MLKLEAALVLLLIAGAGVAGVVAYKKFKAGGIGAVLATLPDAINPNSTGNVVYAAVSQPFDGSLGARIWEWTHPAEVAKEKAITSGSTGAAGKTDQTLDGLFDSSLTLFGVGA